MDRSDSATRFEQPPLWVDMTIEPHPDFSCPVVDSGTNIDSTRINAVGDRCIADLNVTGEPGWIRKIGPKGEQGLCRIFAHHECVPHVNGVENGTISVETFVSDRNVVRNLIESLESEIGSVDLVGLGMANGTDGTDVVRIDLSILTPKQRNALELAVCEDYFENGTTLEELSESLEISTSALSQRLRSGQVKLFRRLFDS